MKPKFLLALIKKSIAIIELKIKYKQRKIISFIVLFDIPGTAGLWITQA